MSEENKALVSRAIEEIWNKSNFAVADELLAADIVRCDPFLPGTIQGREAYTQEVRAFRTAFPEFVDIIDDLIEEGDKVVVRWTVRGGTQKGELIGPAGQVRPTGKGLTFTGVSILEIENGKIARDFAWFDVMSFWKQLGLVSEPAATEANKAVVHRFVDEVINKGNPAALDELFIENIAYRGSNNLDARGIESVRQLCTALLSAFPDIRFTILGEVLTQGDLAVFRWTATGTHKGEWMGIAPTGNRFTYGGTTTLRVAGGKIAEHWADWDFLGLMQQLGAAPAIGQFMAAAAS